MNPPGPGAAENPYQAPEAVTARAAGPMPAEVLPGSRVLLGAILCVSGGYLALEMACFAFLRFYEHWRMEKAGLGRDERWESVGASQLQAELVLVVAGACLAAASYFLCRNKRWPAVVGFASACLFVYLAVRLP